MKKDTGYDIRYLSPIVFALYAALTQAQEDLFDAASSVAGYQGLGNDDGRVQLHFRIDETDISLDFPAQDSRQIGGPFYQPRQPGEMKVYTDKFNFEQICKLLSDLSVAWVGRLGEAANILSMAV